MEKKFDLDKIGKRMPYNVPDGFFDTIEVNILKETTEKERQKPNRRRARLIAIRAFIAVAACVAFLFVFNTYLKTSVTDNVEMSDIDYAFSNLSTDDQAYLVDMYQNDIFINETIN